MHMLFCFATIADGVSEKDEKRRKFLLVTNIENGYSLFVIMQLTTRVLFLYESYLIV